MLGGFQEYLIDKGWKRYTKRIKGKEIIKEYNYKDNFLSGYGPTEYFFSNELIPEIELWYGIAERGKSPCFSIYPIKVFIHIGYRTIEDGYRIIFGNIEFDIIYDMILKQDRYFEISEGENNKIKIKIVDNPHNQ